MSNDLRIELPAIGPYGEGTVADLLREISRSPNPALDEVKLFFIRVYSAELEHRLMDARRKHGLLGTTFSQLASAPDARHACEVLTRALVALSAH